MRIPRKLKKKYKKIWIKLHGVERIIHKSSICFEINEITNKKVWSCITSPKKNNL